MKEILIINTPGLVNRGGMAVVMSSLHCLRECLPEAHITVLCHHSTEDWDTLQKICSRYDVALKKHPWFKDHRSRPVALLHSTVPAMLFLSECVTGRIAAKVGIRRGLLQRSDIVLDLNIDALHDNYGIYFPTWALANILLAKIAGRPVVVWSAGIGPFRSRLTRLAARLVLNTVDVVVAREEVTTKYLKGLGVARPKVFVTADHAFLLEPAPQMRTEEILSREAIDTTRRPLVGISPSQMISDFAFPGVEDREERYQRYIDVMATTIDYLTDKLHATVVLIPHVVSPRSDDRVVSARIYARLQEKDKVRVLGGAYMADELKGIIGMCDMFIGARMHSTIASTSMGVPTIAVVYGQKSHGIIGHMMGQGDHVIEIAKYGHDELLSELQGQINRVWLNRDIIRRDLEDKSSAAKKRALANGTMVRDML